MGNITRQLELIFSAKDKASGVISAVEEKLKKAASSVDALNLKANLLFAGAVINRAATFAKGIIDANDALEDLADKTGETVETVSKLGEIAKLGGTDIETLQKAFKNLAIATVDTPALFASFGISLVGLDGKMKSTNETFLDVADKISKIENPARRVAAATEFFKKSGVDLLPILKLGRDGIKSFTDSIDELGAVTSSSVAKLSGDFNDNLQLIGLAGKGLYNNLSEAILPSVNLLLSTYIEYRKELVAFDKANKDASKSVADTANSSAWTDLISIIGTVGNFLQGAAAGITVIFNVVKGVTGATIALLVARVQLLSAVMAGDFRGAIAVVEQAVKNVSGTISESGSAIDKALNVERFSDGLQRNLAKAVKAAEVASAKSVGLTQDNATLSKNQAIAIVNSTETQITYLSKIVEVASSKAKEALSTHQKTVEEFAALFKRLNREAPREGTLSKQIEKASRDEDVRKKKAALNASEEDNNKAEFLANRLKYFEDIATAENKAYETNKSSSQQLKVESAENDVLLEKRGQKQAAYADKIKKIDQEAIAQETSKQEGQAIRNALEDEFKDIQEQIKKNDKSGSRNELELQRLKDVGALLEKNKADATGVFNTKELATYSQALFNLATDATKKDVDATKAIELATFELAKSRVDTLRQSLSSVELGVSDESVKREAIKIKKILEDGLANIVVPLKVAKELPNSDLSRESSPPGFTSPQRLAEGGRVFGAGTSIEDRIPAWLSHGEFVTPARVMAKPGMTALMEYFRSGGSIDTMFKKAGRFAEGGGYGYGAMQSPGNLLSIDLRTNAGNITANGDTSQDDLNRQLRKQNLRRT